MFPGTGVKCMPLAGEVGWNADMSELWRVEADNDSRTTSPQLRATNYFDYD